MTRVEYSPEEFRIDIRGHANSDELGKDLVCAGCSTLSATLIAAAEEQECFNAGFMIDSETPAIMVSCEPDPECEELCRMMLETVMAGFRALAADFPDYVIIVEDDPNEEY